MENSASLESSSDTTMALNSELAPILCELALKNVMGEVSIDTQNHQLHMSDILQQALEEASQNVAQPNKQCNVSNPVPLNDQSVCSSLMETTEILSNEKFIKLVEQSNPPEITLTFSDHGNVISIPETLNLDNFTVPVFTAETSDAVGLALENLPISTISDSVNLNNSVSFECNLDVDASVILKETDLLKTQVSETLEKDIADPPEELLESIAHAESLSETSNLFAAETQPLENGTIETRDVVPVEEMLPALSLPQPKDTAAPIGSSNNPIQIVQHGSTYHSTQLLNQEQLAQIAQVLQEQQVNKSVETGRSAVLYNPSTNTRIVYRVVYPSGVHAKIGDDKKVDTVAIRSSATPKGRGKSRKVWSRSRPSEDERKLDAPDMSREEKEERKKHRPRTRSGRISKPPSYMIKDYKRIHHLDFNEEPQNESDGGYSDFHLSEEEAAISEDPSSLPSGVTTIKPRNFKCVTCERAYIGRGGLARHYRLFAGHGALSIEDSSQNDPGASDENSTGSLLSENSQSLPSLPQPKEANAVTETVATETVQDRVLTAKPPQKSKEQQISPLAKKKAKLKELIQPFCDADLLEAALPRLSQAVTLWEFLLLKSEKGDPSLPHVPDIFRHFEDLLNRLQLLAQDCLVLTSSSSVQASANMALSGAAHSPPLTPIMNDENKVYVEITNERVAQVLNVSTGLYEVVQCKLLEHVPSLLAGPSRSKVDSSSCKRPAASLLGSPSSKKTKRNPTSVAGMFPSTVAPAVSNPVLPDESSNLPAFRVEETSSLESNSNLSSSAPILDKTVNLHDASQPMDTVEQFGVISAQNQDSNFSNSLDSSCHTNSTEELPCLPISNISITTPLSQSLIFSSPSITTHTVDTIAMSRTSNLPSVTKVSIFNKDSALLMERSGAAKSVKPVLKPSAIIPHIQVRKVNIFSKQSNLLSVSEGTFSHKSSSSLGIQSVEGANSFKGDCSVSVSRTEELSLKPLSTSSDVSSTFLSLLGETPIVMDIPIASLTTTPLTVMSASSSRPSIPPLDALLSQNELPQFRLTEESSALRDALTQSMDVNQSKELECPSTALTSSNDEMPVIQLVVPEMSTPQYSTLESPDFLPGNVVIVQNEDGTTTLQLPTDQPLSIETIQALLAMDHGLAAEILKDNLSGSIDETK